MRTAVVSCPPMLHSPLQTFFEGDPSDGAYVLSLDRHHGIRELADDLLRSVRRESLTSLVRPAFLLTATLEHFGGSMQDSCSALRGNLGSKRLRNYLPVPHNERVGSGFVRIVGRLRIPQDVNVVTIGVLLLH